MQLQGQIEGSLRLTRRNGEWVLSGALRNRLPYELREVQILTPHGAVRIGSLGARETQTLRDEPLFPSSGYGGGRYDFDWGVPVLALSAEQLAQRLLDQRYELPRAFLIARASQPVLTPELREATDRSAEVVYLVSVPLEERP